MDNCPHHDAGSSCPGSFSPPSTACQSLPLGQAGSANEVGLLHEGDIGAHWLEIAVNLYGWHAMKPKVGQLVHADISPFVLHEASDITKGVVALRVVFCEKPCARSEGIEQFDGKDRGVVELLGAKRVLLHLAGNGGKETCFFHGYEGLRNRHDLSHHSRHVKKARRNLQGQILAFFAASGTVNAVFRPS